jgi:hypothetical protein
MTRCQIKADIVCYSSWPACPVIRTPVNPMPFFVRCAIWGWLIAALLVGHYRLMQRLPTPAVQGILFALTGIVLLLYQKAPVLRSWMDRLDLRALVSLHLTRFVGFYFLFLHQQGALPREFAVPAGWGDIITATLALPVCFLPMHDNVRRRAITVWNVIGFLDIMMVVATAARLGLQGNVQIRAFTVLPLSLLPTFLVPLIIATHVIIFLQLRRRDPSA